MNDDQVRRLLAALEADKTPTPTAAGEQWPCHVCDNPGTRNIAAYGYCSTHLAALYATLDPSVWVNGGVGLQTGPARPEYGPLEYDLTCCRCSATWTGVPGAPCWWCQRSFEIQAEMQAEALLKPPDVDTDDRNYENRMKAWADRMAVGVEAGLITAKQAENVWNRALKSKAA